MLPKDGNRNNGSKVNPGIWWGGQGTLQKTCAKDIGAPGRAEGQDLESPVGQSKIGMRSKTWEKRIVLINKLIRAYRVPSTSLVPGNTEIKKHRISALKLLKVLKDNIQGAREKKNRAEQKSKRHSSVLEFSKSGVSSKLKKVHT